MAKVLMFMPTTNLTRPEAPLRMTSQEGVDSFDLVVTRDNPGPIDGDERMGNIRLNYEKMRRMFLAGNYERCWILEHDIIPPPDALVKMLSVDAPVVTALYAHRYDRPTPNLFTWDGGVPVLGLRWEWSDVQKHWGERVQVTGGCQGCIMFDRSSLEGFEFTLTERRGPDWDLMQYMTKNRIKQVACLDVVCGHERENGEVIWPDEGLGFRIELPETRIPVRCPPVPKRDIAKGKFYGGMSVVEQMERKGRSERALT